MLIFNDLNLNSILTISRDHLEKTCKYITLTEKLNEKLEIFAKYIIMCSLDMIGPNVYDFLLEAENSFSELSNIDLTRFF